MNSEILQYYRKMEKKVCVTKNNNYSLHVNPSLAKDAPIHNWYRFKEGYSPQLLNEIICYTKQDNLRLFDPFCGSGTTLLSAAMNIERNVDYGYGTETNPFIYYVAKTKLNYYMLNVKRAEEFINYIRSRELIGKIDRSEIPSLSTVKKAFTDNTLKELINLKLLIKNYFNKDEYEYDFFMLGFASILESVSCMRKSGRALKIYENLIKNYDVKSSFLNKISIMLDDVKRLDKNKKIPQLEVFNQDIRRVNINREKRFNLVVFSPPYLNHFDYTEVYKIELWMLDFIKNSEEFKLQRYSTFRSHPSVKFDKTEIYKNFKSKNIKGLISILDNSNKQEQFYGTIKGYIDDMYSTFVHLMKMTSPGANVACVVANSLFGSKEKENFTPVATDLLISEIATDVGFDVIEIADARRITRRGVSFPYGRESIIFMRKGGIMGKEVELISIIK